MKTKSTPENISIQHIDFIHQDELNQELKMLYEEAFPPDERRDWTQVTELFLNPRFSFKVIYKNQKVVGFITIWNLQKFNFIEHFAIHCSERGKGIGRKVFHQILQNNSGQLILEVEEPLTDSARKRIAFYEKFNFILSDEIYYQPPYSNKKNRLKMLLMSYPAKIQPADFNETKSTIHQDVYKWKINK